MAEVRRVFGAAANLRSAKDHHTQRERERGREREREREAHAEKEKRTQERQTGEGITREEWRV